MAPFWTRVSKRNYRKYGWIGLTEALRNYKVLNLSLGFI